MDWTVARRKMVREQLVARGIKDARVVGAMGEVLRDEFVEPGLKAQAYEDRPVSIGHGQTISQPYVVALMTEALGLTGTERVLEIGTGCGYQTAILSRLAEKVYSIERITGLSNRARRHFYRLGYLNIQLRIGDGSVGWPDEAPFDAILVTAGGPSIPPPFLEQLKEGGRLVMPCGSESEQSLIRVVKKKGKALQEDLGGCRFVKLYGQYGWV